MFWRFHKTCARRSYSPLRLHNDIARALVRTNCMFLQLKGNQYSSKTCTALFTYMFSGTLKQATKENFPLSLEHEEHPVSKYVQGFFFLFLSVLPFSPRWLYMDFLTVSVFKFFYFSPSKYFNSYSYHFACSSRGWRIMYRDGGNFRISSIKVLFPLRRRW